MAALEIFANQAQTTVSSGGTTAPSAGTSQTWTVASSAGFPAASSTASPPTFFRVTDGAASSEKMLVTNVSGTTWTVTRGAEGTTPVTHSSGFTVQNVVTAAALEEMVQAPQAGFILPSGDTSGVTDAAAINAAVSALPSGGGRVVLAAGTWYVLCGQVTVNRSAVYIDGVGRTATYVVAVGSGDCVRIFDQNMFTDAGSGGGMRGLTLDGINTTGTSTGIHTGDLLQSVWDVDVRSFAFNTSSVGVKIDNQWGIFEQAQGTIRAIGNATGVMFTQTPGSGNAHCFGSMERADLTVWLDQQVASNNGIVFNAGVYLDNSILNVFGNFTTSASTLTSAVFTLSGSTPSGSQDGSAGTIPTNVRNCVMNVGVECDDGLAHAPSTWVITSPAGTENISGVMNFGAAGNFTPATGVVSFWGLVTGDASIIPQSTQDWAFLGNVGVGSYTAGAALASNGTIATTSGWAIVSPTAAVTGIILQAGTLDGQLLTLFNASGFTVSMAAFATSGVYTGVPEVIPSWHMRQYWWSISDAQWTPVTEGQGTYTAVLGTSFTSATGTTAQTVTGLSALLNTGTYTVRGWFPYVGAGTVGSTQVFAFTFGGTTATGTLVAWQNHAAAYSAPVIGTAVTTSTTTATITSTTYVMEFTATVVVSAAGTLQLTTQNTTSADRITIDAGAFLEVTQSA